jgi:hypothetical protein
MINYEAISDGIQNISLTFSDDCLIDFRNNPHFSFWSNEHLLEKYFASNAADYCSKFKIIETKINDNTVNFKVDVILKTSTKTFTEMNNKFFTTFSEMNKKFSTTNSQNMLTFIQQDPQWWKDYHAIYSEYRENWSIIPAQHIAKNIDDENWKIADFGCGQQLLKSYLPNNNITGYDFYNDDDSVIIGDYTSIDITEKYNAVVCCLSLPILPDDRKRAFQQAKNVLRNFGCFFIAEPKNRNDLDELSESLINEGFKIIKTEYIDRWLFIICTKQP